VGVEEEGEYGRITSRLEDGGREKKGAKGVAGAAEN